MCGRLGVGLLGVWKAWCVYVECAVGLVCVCCVCGRVGACMLSVR